MATGKITGFTAERMLEIENGTVTSGEVDGADGHLKLETRGGSIIDGGFIMGMKVVKHGTNPNVARPSDAPAVYWVGTADPVYAASWDFWLKENI